MLTEEDAERVLKAIDSTLDIFSPSVQQSLYYYVQKDWGLSREKIPLQPNTFANAIRRIFGVGAWVIETKMIESLQNEFRVALTSNEFVTAMGQLLDKLEKERLGAIG